MVFTILVFLGASLFFYVLLGGADFGAGILELFTGKKGIDVVSKAIAPVWEANHVWLIVVIVILFMGFPPVYASIMLTLHIPILLLLVGIILRGSSFAFRYYDIKEERLQRIYTAFFKYSSLFTPFFLGITLGAVIMGRITLDVSEGFYRVYMYPWLNLFCFSLGLFTVILFSFLASLYLLGEAKKEEDIALFKKYSRRLVVALLVSGLIVFTSAEIDGFHLFRRFFNTPASIISFILATLLLFPLWRSIHKHKVLFIRLTAGAQTFLILSGWFAIQFPVLVNLADSADLTIYSSAAPTSTLTQLIWALSIGLLLVIPALLYLFKVFKFDKSGTDY